MDNEDWYQSSQLPPAKTNSCKIQFSQPYISIPHALVFTLITHTCPGIKYTVDVSRQGPQQFRLKLGTNLVDVVGRRLNDGGLLIQVTLPNIIL